MKSIKRNLWIPGLTLILIACATSPTGRNQIFLLGEGQVDQMGIQSFEELKQKTPIETDPKINAYVRCITVPITQAARGRTQVDNWEIVVFKDPTPNAFALPGGKIGVHTGILPMAKNDAQLAAVIGHEVGHVIAKHGNERMSQGQIAQIIMAGAGMATGKMSPTAQQATMTALGAGAQFGVLLPFSRAQESEADLIGLDLMSQAGFDPHQSVELWKNMSASNGGKAPPQWASTHPSDSTRMAALEENIPKHVAQYESAKAAGRSPHCVLK
ncbi:MAG: M48 family metallopeptidase [Bdellovibrionales bacterium]|nr:M48 family metallopeptidase [Oligoflexia bacterium]